jgi:glutamate 5-kinase
VKLPDEIATQPLRAKVMAARKVVVKIGSQVLCQGDGSLDSRVLEALATDLAQAKADGREVAVVSSGAVALGTGLVRGAKLCDLGKQALAAVGQPLLMDRWRDAMAVHGLQVAQILLTHADLDHRGRWLHARRVMAELLAAGVVPVVNENDTVAIEELRFGDNDHLAAQVAHVVGADLLVLLTEVDGLYSADPRQDAHAKRYGAIAAQSEEALRIAGAGTSQFGTGGMRSKVLAARKAGDVGVMTAVAAGKQPGTLGQLLAGAAVGTLFAPPSKKLTGRRSWIATSGRVKGVLHVDAGAAEALRKGGRSLLPIGVKAVDGSFEVGDVVKVVDLDGVEIGRGLVRYDADDARKAAGLRSDRLQATLGWEAAAEIVHRDDFVVAG